MPQFDIKTIRAGSCANDGSVLETESELEKFSTKIQKYFPIHFTYSESCVLSKVNCKQKRMSQKLKKTHTIFLLHDPRIRKYIYK